MKIFLDDQGGENDVRYNWVGPEWKRVLTVPDFQDLVNDAVSRGEKIEEISFDNDLGEELEGHHALAWLRHEHPNLFDGSVVMQVHSKNSQENMRMSSDIKWARENIAELIEAKNRPPLYGEEKTNFMLPIK